MASSNSSKIPAVPYLFSSASSPSSSDFDLLGLSPSAGLIDESPFAKHARIIGRTLAEPTGLALERIFERDEFTLSASQILALEENPPQEASNSARAPSSRKRKAPKTADADFLEAPSRRRAHRAPVVKIEPSSVASAAAPVAAVLEAPRARPIIKLEPGIPAAPAPASMETTAITDAAQFQERMAWYHLVYLGTPTAADIDLRGYPSYLPMKRAELGACGSQFDPNPFYAADGKLHREFTSDPLNAIMHFSSGDNRPSLFHTRLGLPSTRDSGMALRQRAWHVLDVLKKTSADSLREQFSEQGFEMDYPEAAIANLRDKSPAELVSMWKAEPDSIVHAFLRRAAFSSQSPTSVKDAWADVVKQIRYSVYIATEIGSELEFRDISTAECAARLGIQQSQLDKYISLEDVPQFTELLPILAAIYATEFDDADNEPAPEKVAMLASVKEAVAKVLASDTKLHPVNPFVGPI